jgi:hypothetical protein
LGIANIHWIFKAEICRVMKEKKEEDLQKTKGFPKHILRRETLILIVQS